MSDFFHEAIIRAQIHWKGNPFQRLGDPNLIDFYLLANTICESYECRIPSTLPSKDVGLE